MLRWSLSTQTPEAKLHATVLRVLSCAAPTRSSSLIRSCSCHCLLVFVRRAYRKPKFDLSLCGDFIGMSLVFVLCVLACLCVSVCVCACAQALDYCAIFANRSSGVAKRLVLPHAGFVYLSLLIGFVRQAFRACHICT